MLAPYLLIRQCSLSSDSLEGLRLHASLMLHAETSAMARSLSHASQRLADALFPYVDTEDLQTRRAILRVKRALFNARPSEAKDLQQVLCAVDPQLAAQLKDWHLHFERRRSLLQQAEAEADREFAAARAQLATLIETPRFLEAVQLSGRRLHQQALEYVQAVRDGRPLGKSLRQTEERLVSYLFRMGYKPSPYGAFTELILAASGGDELVAPCADPPLRDVRVSRDLLLWMQWQAARRIEALRAHLPLSVNNTLVEAEGRYLAYLRAPDGSHEMLRREALAAFPATPALRGLVEHLMHRGGSRDELANLLAQSGQPLQACIRFVEQLIDKGILQRDFAVADQTPRFAAAAAARLAPFGDDDVTAVREHFAQIDRLEQAFPQTDAAGRALLIDRFESEIRAFSERLQIDDPGFENIRTFFFEDVGRVGSPDKRLNSQIERVAPSLLRISRLLGLFDPTQAERIALYHFFVRHFGDAGDRAVDVMTLYRTLAAQGAAGMHKAIVETDHPDLAQLDARRDEFFAHLRAHAGQDQDQVQLAGDWLDDFVHRLPDALQPWDSATFYLQFDGSLAVLNDAATGYGASLARFCSLFAQASPGAIRAFARYLEQRCPDRQLVQLVSVLGVNTNLHPALIERELVYPGCRAEGAAPLHLHDVAVKADPATRRLLLHEKATGRPLQLVSLNALFPAVGPSLYRMLHLLTPFVHYNATRMLHGFATSQGSTVEALPRFMVDDVVLARRAWRIPKAALFDPAPPQSSLLQRNVAMDDWRRSIGLPERGFFRQFARPSAASAPGAGAPQDINALRRGRLRKPHYLDFANPFLTAVLERQAADIGPDASLVVQECLPAAGSGTVREVAVQIDRATNAMPT